MDLKVAAVRTYCLSNNLPDPVAEFRFHPDRRWRFDLAWTEQKVAMEFQGGNWTGGRHTRGQGFENDCEKFSEAAVLGWRVVPVTIRQLKSGAVYGILDRLFAGA